MLTERQQRRRVSKARGRAALAAVLVALASRGVADVIDIANSVRLEDCRQTSAEVERLHRDARLDEAARRIASGEGLEAAVSEAGYHDKVSASIRVATEKGGNGIAQVLAKRFCGTLASPDLREIGAFQRGELTWMVLASRFVPPRSVDRSKLDDRVLQLINDARRQGRRCGNNRFPATTPLQRDAALDQAASAHARDMASSGRLGHEGSDGTKPADRVTGAGYSWTAVAENIAAGQSTAEEAVRTWLESPGHCESLMSPRYSETGIAHAINREAEKGIYWVQVFATPK